MCIQARWTGDLAVVWVQGEYLDAACGVIGGSAAPLDRRFRDHVQDVHGLSLADGVPIPELVLDYDSEA